MADPETNVCWNLIARAIFDRLGDAVLVVDALARVMQSNQAARFLLAEPDGLCLHLDRLACPHADDTARLHRAIDRAARRRAGRSSGEASWFALKGSPSDHPLAIHVIPLGDDPAVCPVVGGLSARDGLPAAVVVASSPVARVGVPRNVLEEAFGLTPAEVELIWLVARGENRKQIAYALGKSINTVKNQLNRIFRKTMTSSQVELMRLLSEWAPRMLARATEPNGVRRKARRRPPPTDGHA